MISQGNRTIALGEALRLDAEITGAELKGDEELKGAEVKGYEELGRSSTASLANSTTANAGVQVSWTGAPLADYYPDPGGAGGAGGAGVADGAVRAADGAGARRRAAAIGELLRPPLVPRLALLSGPSPSPSPNPHSHPHPHPQPQP